MIFNHKFVFWFLCTVSVSWVMGQNLSDGLIGHWKFDESSGTTANDASGNNYHAELFNAGDGSSSWVDGKVNGGIELDGTDDYLAIQTLNYTQAGEIPAMTAVAWVKTSKTDQSYVISYDRSENWRFTVSGDLNNGRMYLASTDSSGTTSDDYGNTILNDGTWHLVVASYDSSTSVKKFYLDGNPDGTITTHSNNSLGAGNTTRFGVIGTGNEDVAYNTFQNTNGETRNYVHNFQGTLDEIRLYDRALTDAEVNYLYFQATNDSDADGLSNAEEDNLGTSSSNTDTDGDGISDWDEINGYRTYTQVDGAMTWTAAKADAESRGGYLATITSSDENEKVLASISGNRLWLGGSDATSEGSWTWITGEDWGFSFWNDQGPSPANSSEDYLELVRSGTYSWNDNQNTDSWAIGYVLETEFSPTNPLQSDSDGDGVDDLSEINQGRNPNFVELTDWTAVGNGIWNLQSNDLSVLQTENSTVIYFLSPYDVQNKKITYQMKVSGSTDNDWIGFVVGFQDSSNYSYFTLTRSEQTGAGNPPDGWNFIEVSNGVSTTLASDESNYTKGWELDADYNVTISYTSGKTSIHLQGGSLAFATGSSLVELNRQNPSGKFGFYGSSQEGITFSNLKFEPLHSPTITLVGNASETLEGASSFSDPGANASDTEDGNLTASIQVSGAVDLNTVGTYALVYSITDSSGIEANVTRTVHVVDTTNPLISLVGNSSITHEAGIAYTDAGANWTDTVDGSGNLTGSGTVDINTVGAYTLTFDYTDAAGNAGLPVTRTVNVVDNTSPMITLTGDATVTHEAATAYTDLGASWSDAVDGNGNLTANGTVDINTVGAYILTYDYTDAAGNAAAQVTRTVNVVDTTKPVISLLGDQNISHFLWTPYSDAGALASDSLDGNLTASLVLINGVDVNLPGNYLLSYHVQDTAGNDAVSVIREVEVVNQAPTKIYLSNLSIEENLPAGTGVGTFSTLDPDDSDQNRSYQYNLVGGDGMASFELSNGGTLQSAAVFNYESKSSYDLTIRTMDEFGGSLDQNFTIEILDAFHAIVDTGTILEVGDNFVSVSGEVLDPGGLAGVGQRGFLVSTTPEPIYGDWESIQTQAGSGVGTFNAEVKDLNPGTQYYVTAYVVGYEGISYGASEKFSTTKAEQPLFISDAQKVEGSPGWWRSSWLGEFYEVENNGWLLHAQIGWLYAVPDATDGVWFWNDKLGWVWSKAGIFPYFHANDSQGWIFFHGNDANHSLFYDYENHDWIMIQK